MAQLLPESDVLPTYEAATNRNPLALAAPYVRRADLFAACLVCRRWREAFADELWARPDVLWEVGDRAVLTKFLLFLRTLSTTPTPRPQTHTLSLLSIQPTLYSPPPSKWLSLLLLRLPALTALTLSALPFFDQPAILQTRTHALTALSATGHTNTTPAALVHLITHLPNLASLDLSATHGAAHGSTLAAVAGLRRLCVLGLRALGLGDGAVAPVLRARGTGLRVLDVRGNRLGDGTVGVLRDECFAPPAYPGARAAGGGLTVLRVAGNRVSARGVVALVKAGCLGVLDVGVVEGGVEGVVEALREWGGGLEELRVDSRVLVEGWRGRRLVLCGVPEVADERWVGGLVRMMGGFGEGVEVVELEMAGWGVGVGGGEGAGKGDFSFFPGEGEGGSVCGEVGMVGVVEVVGRWRKACRESGRGWGGKVRVVRELGIECGV